MEMFGKFRHTAMKWMPFIMIQSESGISFCVITDEKLKDF